MPQEHTRLMVLNAVLNPFLTCFGPFFDAFLNPKYFHFVPPENIRKPAFVVFREYKMKALA